MVEGNGRLRSWQCPACRSFAANTSVIRAAVGTERFNAIWAGLRDGGETGTACPACLQSMNATGIDGIRLDACPVCAIVFFDAGEWDATLADGAQDPTRRLDDTEIARHLARLREARDSVKPVTGDTRPRLRITLRRPGHPRP